MESTRLLPLPLEELPPGHFFAYGPAIDDRGVVLVRASEVLTTHESRGATAGAAPPLDSPRRILKELGDLSELPGEEDSGEDGLRERIADLEDRLRKTEGASGRPSRGEIEEEVRRETERDRRREIAEEVETTRALERRLSALQAVLDESALLARCRAAALKDAVGTAPEENGSEATEGTSEERTGAEAREEDSGGGRIGGCCEEDVGPDREAREPQKSNCIRCQVAA